MSEHTLQSLADLIRVNRAAREEQLRVMNQMEPARRTLMRVQIAANDQAYRKQLDSIDELPALLHSAPRLQENWPYPPHAALEVVRAEVARLGRRELGAVDQLRLGEVVSILSGGNGVQPPSESSKPSEARSIVEVDVLRLPRWARVAFLARCARRGQRILLSLTPEPSNEEIEGIESAIRFAEQAAATGSVPDGTRQAAERAFQRANGKIAVMRPHGAPPHELSLHERMLYAVGNAAALAARYAVAQDSSNARESFEHAQGGAFVVGSVATLDGMRKDWNYLRSLADRDHWNDETPVAVDRIPTPHLTLTGLHVRGLRSIRSLDLPTDGLGWGNRFPELVMLGGVNGSGKTTLLQFLADSLEALSGDPTNNMGVVRSIPTSLMADEAWVEFEIESYEIPKTRIRLVVGDKRTIEEHKSENCCSFERTKGPEWLGNLRGNTLIRMASTIEKWFRRVSIPSAIFFPSDDRTLTVPSEEYKSAGRIKDAPKFVSRWERPRQWQQSLEAVLYSQRWEDLNAAEEGRFTEVSHFEAYSEAFRRFTGGTKYLAWEQGELVIRIPNSSVRHDLAELSSGEKQVLLLTGELLRRWRPGSLVMIDEPELHLHSSWQTKLYEALRYWQAERGGQVILATQSSHLFHIAEPGSVALLGVESL